MPASHNDYWQLLTKYRDIRMTQKEWARYFAAFPDCPLVPVVGARADFIRCPDTNIPLYIHENWNGTFSALPPVDSELDSRFDGLTIEDLRLFQLDWPTICQKESHRLELAGSLRSIPDKPWFWRLGELRTDAHIYPYFLAVIRSPQEADEVAAMLKPQPSARLLVPCLPDKLFHRLTEAKMAFHVLDDGTAPQFPVVETKRVLYMLRQGHGKWSFIVDGLEGIINEEKGLLYIDYLFKNPPSEPIHASVLAEEVRIVEKKSPGLTDIVDPDSGQAVPLSRSSMLQERNLGWDDSESNRLLWRKRRECRRLIDDPTASELEKAEAREELDAIEEAFSTTIPRTRGNAVQTYDRIRQAIGRLIKHLEEFRNRDGSENPAYVAFVEHIRNHLMIPTVRYSGRQSARIGAKAQSFMYEPPAGVVWSD